MKISREFKIGFFFVLAIAALLWGLSFLKGKDFFSKEQRLFTVYPFISGLVKTDPVYINGLKVGQVGNVYFDKDMSGNIIVELSLTGDFPIPSNSVSKIFSSDLMGTKAIELILGDSPDLAQNGDTLTTDVEQNLKDAVNQQIAPLKIKVENLISSIDTMVVTIEELFNQEIRSELLASIKSIRYTFQNLESTTQTLDTLLLSQSGHVANVLYNLDLITLNLRENEDEIDNILNNLSVFSDSLSHANIPKTFENLNLVVSEISEIVTSINNGEGTIGQLLANDSLYIELEKTAYELNQLLEDIRVNPKRYVRFSLF